MTIAGNHFMSNLHESMGMGQRIEPTTPGSAVGLAADCTTRPSTQLCQTLLIIHRIGKLKKKMVNCWYSLFVCFVALRPN